MRKVLIAVFAGGAALAVSFLYYTQSQGETDFAGYQEWLQSALRSAWYRVFTGVGSVTGTASYKDIATSFIAEQETFSSKVYPDAGKLAIGYGHDLVPGDGFDASSTISESDAWALLQSDLETFDACIDNNVTVDLTANQRAALLSFVYNVGCAGFAGSTMLKRINAGDFAGASSEFGRWIYTTQNGVHEISQALVNRRTAEVSLFES